MHLAEQAKQLGAAVDNPTTLAWAEYALAEALLDDQPDRARLALDRAVAHARTARNRFVLGVALISAGSLHTRHGNPTHAAALLAEAIDHWSQAGNWTQQWITIRHVIDLLVRLAVHEQAAVLFGALTESTTATTAYGPDADRLRSHADTLRTQLGPQRYSAAVERGVASPTMMSSTLPAPRSTASSPHSVRRTTHDGYSRRMTLPPLRQRGTRPGAAASPCPPVSDGYRKPEAPQECRKP